MKSALNIFMISILGLFVSFCSSTPDTPEDNQPQYEDYDSSGVYNDIEGESRTVSSEEDYEDDDYGDAGSEEEEEDDDKFLSGADEEEDNSEPEAIPEPAAQMAAVQMSEIEEEEKEEVVVAKPMKKMKKKKRRKKASIGSFKNGLYKFSRACNMRQSASKKGAKAGKVTTKRKLWVEAHNANWVKVNKKSGPVYVHKTCL